VTLPWLEPGEAADRDADLHDHPWPGRAQDNLQQRRVAAGARGAGLADVRENGMHALRHYYVSVLLAGGVDIRALSEYPGHHDPAFTLRIYAHLMPGADDRARRAVEAALGAAGADGPGAAQEGGGRP
jgi:integrase